MAVSRFLLTCLLCLPLSAQAGPATEALGQCLIGKTTGDDRMVMMRWMTVAFASHPSVADVVTLDRSKVAAIDQAMADLVTDLLVTRCHDQTIAAVAEAGSPGIALQTAFEALGGTAAQEAMQAPEVNQSVLGFSKYLDEKRLNEVLQQ